MIFTRMTTSSLNESVLNHLYENQFKLNELQQQIATGKKIDSPSDDPSAAINILTSNSNLDKIDIYNKNIDYAISETDMTDKVLGTVTDTIQRLKELTVQASNFTNGPTELKNINEEVKQIKQTLIDAGNTKFGNKFLFAGVSTETTPFTEDTSTDETLYNGTPSTGDYKRNIEISKNTTIDINLPGDDIFGYYKITDPIPVPPTVDKQGLLGAVTTLTQELDKDPPDYDAIRATIEDLDNSLNTVLNARAKIGGLATRLEMTKNKLDNDTLNYTKFKSAAEDIDLAKAISDLSFQELTYRASMQVGAKVLQPSLLNYM